MISQNKKFPKRNINQGWHLKSKVFNKYMQQHNKIEILNIRTEEK